MEGYGFESKGWGTVTEACLHRVDDELTMMIYYIKINGGFS